MPRWLAPLLLLCAGGCSPSAPPSGASAPSELPSLRLQGRVMGTSWHAVLVGKDLDATRLRRTIQERLDEVDHEMSTYRPDSELRRFGAMGAGVDFPVSADTARVMTTALEVARLSDGAFDPTVAPLVDLWGFGPTPPPEHAPGPEALRTARERVDWRRVQVLRDPPSLRKERDGIALDLSGIAKGYGVDAAWERLAELGIRDFFLEVGGEVRTSGMRPDGSPWRVGIDRPDPGLAGGERLQHVVALSGGAIATSGDYRNFRIVDGLRISHTIDPRTGRPLQNPMASVSILAPDCMHADALATAVEVLGPERGLALVEGLPGVEAYLILHRPGGGFEERMSDGFAAALLR